MAQSLYDKYGGFPTISAVVQLFYDKIDQTPALARYFEHVKMPALIGHQTKFLCKVLGGPDNYEGRDLERAHKHLDIDGEAFGIVAGLLKESLDESGVEAQDVATILSIVGSVRGSIVSRE